MFYQYSRFTSPASYKKHDIVYGLGVIPIDYKSVDLIQEINKLTSYDDERESGVDTVFDGIGGKSFKSSYEILLVVAVD